MLYVKLTDAQRAELEQVSRQVVGRVALRTQMVLYWLPAASVHEQRQ